MNKPGMEGPEKQKADGYEVRSGPRTTGDGIAAFEGNQIAKKKAVRCRKINI